MAPLLLCSLLLSLLQEPPATGPAESRPARRRPAIERPEQPVELEADRKPATRTGGDCLIRDATVLTVSHGTIPRASILVRGGKIAAVGADLAAPAGVAVIDARGKFVAPGMEDCHSHMAIEGVNEGTVSISAEVRIRDVINPDDETIYRALAGGTTLAHLLHGSANVIGGQDAVIKLRYGKDAAGLLFDAARPGIKFALGENPKQSNSPRDASRPGRFPGTRMGVEAVLRRAFTEAREYAARWKEYEARKAEGEDVLPPRKDLRLDTLLGILRGEISVHSHCYRADEILMLLRTAESFGFRIRTLQHVLEGYKVARELAAHGVGASTFSDWWAYKMEAYDAIPYNGALLIRAGVFTSFNSDSGELVRRLHLECAKGMKYGGLTEDEALALLTLNPAKQLGVDARTGSIDLGKDADLAIYDAHPMSVYAKCVMTLVDGEVYFERRPEPWSDFAAGLAKAAEARRKADAEEAPETQPAPSSAKRTKGPVGWRAEKVAVRPGPPIAGAGAYAIRGATIHPVTASPIESGTIVLRGGWIAEVGGREIPVPSDATVIDARGLHVYPGLLDSGTTLGLTEVGAVAATRDSSEMGTIQSDCRVAASINPESEHIPVARVNGITTAVVHPGGALLAGQSALVRLDGWTWEEMVVQDPLALHVSFPSVPRRDDEEEQPRPAGPQPQEGLSLRLKPLKEAFGEAREYGRKQDEARARGLRPIAPDLRLEALVPYVRGEKPVVIHASGRREIREAVKFAEENGIKIAIAGGLEAWKVADLLAAKDVPVLVGPVLATPREDYDPYDAAYANASVLGKVGVRFAFQTDDSSNVRNLPYQAGMAAAFGLPKEEALRAVTIAPAEIWGVGHLVGSLEVGKVADVIVTDGDPLEIRTQVRHLFLGGKPVSLETKHTRLYEKYLKRLRDPGLSPSPAALGGEGATPADASGERRTGH
ncbi:MAG TPA: amidohydrolase family protein [Planctomycetota bacterium]|nr:amidohydrolase family protein [Planctomycetota bacterium]